MFQIYLNSVGHNACLHLNVPPNTDGLLDDRDVKRLQEYGDLLKQCFSQPVDYSAEHRTDDEIVLRLKKPVKAISFVVLQEDLTQGQRVESFEILAGDRVLYRGKTVGNKQICCLKDPFSRLHWRQWGMGCENTLRIHISSARDIPALKTIAIYEEVRV